MGEVRVFGVNYSPFSLRVEIALKLKGIDYEFVPEDPVNKSEQLLKYNPIYKKVPVFIHQGRTLVESLVILEYIDETWKDKYPLLPSDSYERGQVRFWAKFIDEKLLGALRNARWGPEEEREKGIEELKEAFNVLQREVEGKKFLGGNNIGYLDLVAIFPALWVPVLLEAEDEDVISRLNFPGFFTWADHLLGSVIVKDFLPDREKLVTFYRARIPCWRVGAPTPKVLKV